MFPSKHGRLQATVFSIEKPRFDAALATAHFHYRLGEHRFTETLVFASGFDTSIATTPIFSQAMDLAACVLGVSYFKLKAPLQISAPDLVLTKLQQKLVLDIYENGLGEFYARNDLCRFGQIELNVETTVSPSKRNLFPSDKALLLIGGGKDSLVSVQLAEAAGINFTPFAVNPKGPILTSVEKVVKPPLYVTRTLDPEMIRLGTQPGYYNGHVPSTAINSIVATLAALLFGFDAIILSNERSASEGNTIHDGRTINHQHSKSYDFECLMRNALSELTHSQLDYFSLLRPYSEVRIAKMFAGSSRFDTVFSSCNTNFRLKGHDGDLWCNTCPKCHFVFLIFAPFMEPERLDLIFGGNILDNPESLASFRQLTGLAGQKPWECVGEILEAAACIWKLSKDADWQNSEIISALGSEIETRYGPLQLEGVWGELMTDSELHNIPGPLAKRIQDSKN